LHTVQIIKSERRYVKDAISRKSFAKGVIIRTQGMQPFLSRRKNYAGL